MSAQPCGCDREAAWMCKRHLEEALSGSGDVPLLPMSSNLTRFQQRLADEDTMRGTVPIENTLAPVVERLTAKCAELRTERAQIAAVLATFYRAELSMSSVQPLLTLALELNPDLVERTR